MLEIVIWFVASFISTFGVCYVYLGFTDTKYKFNWKSCLVFLGGVVFLTLLEFLNSPISTISYFIFFPIMFYVLKPLPIKKHIFYLALIWSYGIIFDLISMLFILIFYFIIKFDVYSKFFTIVPSLFVFVMLMLCGHNKYVKKFNNFLLTAALKIKYVDFILSIFSLFTLILAIGIAVNIKHLQTGILLFLLVFLSIIMFLTLVINKIKDVENNKFLKTLKENNEFYIKLDDDNRIFKHNLVAKLLSIKSVSNKKAMVLIEDLLESFNKNISFTKGIRIIPYGLNGIIYQKLYPYFEKLNIKINNEIDYDIFKYLRPRRYNVLVEKMVIALDNAIEASLNSKRKLIFINIADNDNYINVVIKNSFDSNINIDNLGNMNYSTKGKRRGLGLFSALRDNEAKMEVKIVNNLFETKIFAKKRVFD